MSQSDFTTAKTYLESFLIISAPRCSTKRNIKLLFVNISSFVICFSLQYQIIQSGNSTHRIGQMLPNAHFDDSYCLFHPLFSFMKCQISHLYFQSPIMLAYFPESPSNLCSIRMSLRKTDSSSYADTIKSFCFQHVTEIWASLFSNWSQDFSFTKMPFCGRAIKHKEDTKNLKLICGFTSDQHQCKTEVPTTRSLFQPSTAVRMQRISSNLASLSIFSAADKMTNNYTYPFNSSWNVFLAPWR